MTEEQIRQLIDSYIVDNQASGITPAKLRDMMQKTVDFITETIAGSPTLDNVLENGNISVRPIFSGASSTTGIKTKILPGTVAVEDGVIGKISLQIISSNGTLLLFSGSTGNYASIQAAAGYTANADFMLPSTPGTLLVNGSRDVKQIVANYTLLQTDEIIHIVTPTSAPLVLTLNSAYSGNKIFTVRVDGPGNVQLNKTSGNMDGNPSTTTIISGTAKQFYFDGANYWTLSTS